MSFDIIGINMMEQEVQCQMVERSCPATVERSCPALRIKMPLMFRKFNVTCQFKGNKRKVKETKNELANQN